MGCVPSTINTDSKNNTNAANTTGVVTHHRGGRAGGGVDSSDMGPAGEVNHVGNDCQRETAGQLVSNKVMHYHFHTYW